MGQVLLVRHGQASWGAADYDVLSPLGERQATATGAFLAGVRPDAVVHGLMQRQRRTAELMAEAAGWSLAPSVDGRWDEMDHLAVLDAQPRDFDGEPDAHQFQAWFEKATGRWLSGAHDGEYAESWPEFRDRVLAGLDALGDGTTVVVTSGGPISDRRRAPARVVGGLPAHRPRRRQRVGHQGRGRSPRPHPRVVQRARPPAGRPAHLPLTAPVHTWYTYRVSTREDAG